MSPQTNCYINTRYQLQPKEKKAKKTQPCLIEPIEYDCKNALQFQKLLSIAPET